MASSGTYTTNYETEELVAESFERCGLDPATLVARHAKSARRSLNLLFSRWANKGSRLFAIDEQTQTMTISTPSYTAATGTLAILEAVIRRSSVDTPVNRISREQYHMIPNKTNTGLPSSLYLDRRTGTYYMWQVPENSTDVLRYYRMRRLQDVTTGLETLDVPYHWFEAVAAGLAENLSLKYAPDRFATLKGIADERFAEAREEDRERVDTTVSLG